MTLTAGVGSSDEQLVELLRKGDEAAFGWLIDTYGGSLKRLALAFVAGDAMAEDVVQETWLAVLTGIARFEGRSAVKTWLFQILANRAKTHAVRERRTIPFSDLELGGAGAEPAVTGAYMLQVRVVDGIGSPQEPALSASYPNGASGYHTVRIDISS